MSTLDDIKDRVDDSLDDFKESVTSGALYWVIIILIMALLLVLGLGFYWSSEPDLFAVQQRTEEIAKQQRRDVVIGSYTTSTLIAVAETLMQKPGGYLSNDLFPPGALLDNIPSWEYGVLLQIRDLSRVMRESFSRSQSQSLEDKDLTRAQPEFNFSHNSWWLPDTQDRYQKGIEYLYSYLLRLADPQTPHAQFYARADNLNRWLMTVEVSLGGLSQRLSASVGQDRTNTDLAGEENASQSTPSTSMLQVQTPWLEIDNVFYEARGTAWVLIHFLSAVELDFKDILSKKKADKSLRQIIHELEATQHSVFSPMILNGDGFGLLANHSLVMASYISRANAAIIDLRVLLERG